MRFNIVVLQAAQLPGAASATLRWFEYSDHTRIDINRTSNSVIQNDLVSCL